MSPAASSSSAKRPAATPLTSRSFTSGGPGDDVELGAVQYGPDIPTEADLRLLGHQLTAKRVVVLGSGAGAAAVTLAKTGTKVIAVDPSEAQLSVARRLAEREEVRIEIHRGDIADLAFLGADTVDAVLAIYALGGVADVDRVFRQVHRILRTEAPFVLSLPHPTYRAVDPASDPPALSRRYFDRSPIPWTTDDDSGEDAHHTISDLVTGLIRANFRIDTMLEPAPNERGPHSRFWAPAMAWLPATLIIRARKQGI